MKPILPVRPTLARAIDDGGVAKEQTLSDIFLDLRMYPDTYPVTSGLLQLFSGEVPLGAPIAIPLANGRALYTIAKGFQKLANKFITGILSVSPEGQPVQSARRNIDIGAITLTVDSNNDTVVDDKDDADVRNDPSQNDSDKALRFAFWDAADGKANDENSLTDYATVRLRININLSNRTHAS